MYCHSEGVWALQTNAVIWRFFFNNFIFFTVLIWQLWWYHKTMVPRPTALHCHNILSFRRRLGITNRWGVFTSFFIGPRSQCLGNRPKTGWTQSFGVQRVLSGTKNDPNTRSEGTLDLNNWVFSEVVEPKWTWLPVYRYTPWNIHP